MPTVRTEDLIDAQAVAEIIGLAHRNAVSGYLSRYPDMPRPVIDLGPNRPRLWIRQEIEAWTQPRPPIRRGRPRKASSPPPTPTPEVSRDDKAPLRGAASAGGHTTRDTRRNTRGDTHTVPRQQTLQSLDDEA
jgi:glutathione-regulated potassium-efflux system ancillary protein KefG